MFLIVLCVRVRECRVSFLWAGGVFFVVALPARVCVCVCVSTCGIVLVCMCRVSVFRVGIACLPCARVTDVFFSDVWYFC